MKFQFEDGVLDYLRGMGAADVTLDVEDLPTPCCVGRLPELRITLAPPATAGAYRNFCANDINIHLSNLLRTGEQLTFFMSGFGPFRKLEVGGVNLVL